MSKQSKNEQTKSPHSRAPKRRALVGSLKRSVGRKAAPRQAAPVPYPTAEAVLASSRFERARDAVQRLMAPVLLASAASAVVGCAEEPPTCVVPETKDGLLASKANALNPQVLHDVDPMIPVSQLPPRPEPEPEPVGQTTVPESDPEPVVRDGNNPFWKQRPHPPRPRGRMAGPQFQLAGAPRRVDF